MPASYVYEPYHHVQTTPVTEVTISHNFGRRVNVQVYGNDQQPIFPVIEQIPVIGQTGAEPTIFNQVKISFYKRGVLSAMPDVTGEVWRAVIS